MRAHQFILLEYRRDVTSKNYGDAIINRLATSRLGTLHYALDGYSKLLRYIANPSMYTAAPFTISTPSGHIVVEPDRAEQIAQSLRQEMIDDTLSVIEEHDPTQHKEYTQWLLRRWLTDPEREQVRMEDYNRDDLLRAYHMGKRRGLIHPDHRDINRFRTYRQFERMMHDNYNIDELLNIEATSEPQDRGTYSEVYKDDSVRVIVPRDENAACFWGRGTRWCTAATRGSNYFNTYNQQGPLYILLPTKRIRPGEKYQIHIPSGQFMNEDDTPVDVANLARNVFPQFFAWLREHDPRANELVAFADDETLTSIWKTVDEIAVKLFKKRSIENGYDDDDYMEELSSRGALDVDGSIDSEVVDRLDLQYWNWNDDYRHDMNKMLLVSKYDAVQIRKWAEEGTLNIGGEFSTVDGLPSLFLYALYESQETRTVEVLDNLFSHIFVYDEKRYGERSRYVSREQRTHLVRRIGPYYIGYLSDPEFQD